MGTAKYHYAEVFHNLKMIDLDPKISVNISREICQYKRTISIGLLSTPKALSINLLERQGLICNIPMTKHSHSLILKPVLKSNRLASNDVCSISAFAPRNVEDLLHDGV